MVHSARSLRRRVRAGSSDAPGPVVDALGRIGLVGYGVVHLLVAWLALQVAFGVPDENPNARGAVDAIAAGPGGLVALGVLVIGLIAFALWQVVAAVLGFRWVDGEERFRKRVGAVSKAVVGLLAGAAALFADPNRAGGLDVALRALGGTGLGASLLVVVAAGFGAFRLLCFVDAATRRA